MKDIIVPESYLPLYDETTIIKYPNNKLRIKSETVNDFEWAKNVLSKMVVALEETPGVGISAPQIGENLRIVIIKSNINYHIINPIIKKYSGFYLSDEGCLSVPGVWGKVPRYENIIVSGFKPNGDEISISLDGFPAAVAQHEIDHLDGVLFFDKALTDSLHWFTGKETKFQPVEIK